MSKCSKPATTRVLLVCARILICASEDVGNADPRALVICAAACRSGICRSPEARILLAKPPSTLPARRNQTPPTLPGSAISEVQRQTRPFRCICAIADRESRGHIKVISTRTIFPVDCPGRYARPKTFTNRPTKEEKKSKNI